MPTLGRVKRHKKKRCIMLKAEFMLPLPNGDKISFDEILSPFIVYRVQGLIKDEFLLIPKEGQTGLLKTIFMADEKGARKYDMILEPNRSDIPQNIQTKVCADLINMICYKKQ